LILQNLLGHRSDNVLYIKQITVDVFRCSGKVAKSMLPKFMTTAREKWVEMSIREVWTQCKFALIAYNILLSEGASSTDATFFAAHSFLSHAANVSKLLKTKDIDPPNHNNVIGDELNIDVTSIIHNRDLRNHLEHYDERLQLWILAKGPGANIGTYNVGNKSMIQIPGMVFVTHYDPASQTFTFVDEDYNLKLISEEIRRVQEMADDWVTRSVSQNG